jgi:hypothetical protein
MSKTEEYKEPFEELRKYVIDFCSEDIEEVSFTLKGDGWEESYNYKIIEDKK